ncbi:hypothetical protein [Metamycoplasma equirhinis]|uniref:hypothetical protein n=1 Tax=Metamycoplasma equirhinis TaxID=92402 RepID=UPI003593D238
MKTINSVYKFKLKEKEIPIKNILHNPIKIEFIDDDIEISYIVKSLNKPKHFALLPLDINKTANIF